MTQQAALSHSTPRAKYRRRGRAWVLGMIMSTLSFGVLGQAKENQRVEALGVVNGNMTARNTQVDITVFLSGQPLFQVTEAPEAIGVLTLEQTRLVSKDGNTFRIQQELTLSDGTQGSVLLPVQVRVNGKPVTASVTESSLGVVVTLPSPAQTVDLVPAGAVQLTVPVGYRGDLNTQWRVTGEASLLTE
ncbi:DUF5462 family protein [Providencia stuartii]|uniref:DUF5462 family protein n=1 Tax=Providencia stuartii TaxID=588 RepID=UPI0034E46049